MKKIFLAFLLFASNGAFAGTEVRSIRTSYDFIEIGSSEGDVRSKLGNPQSVYHYVLRDANNRPRAATDLRYTVDNEKYTVIIVNGVVYKIVWER